MSAFRTEIKNMFWIMVATKTKKERQEAQEDLMVALSNEVKEVLENHFVIVRQEVQNKLKDSGGQEGNQQTNNRDVNHKKLLSKDLQKKLEKE